MRLAFTLKCLTGFTEITQIKAGKEFDLALFVQDLRPEVDGMARGVFSAYCNVNFLARYVTCGAVLHTPPYTSGKNCQFTEHGFREWGGFAGLEPTGSAVFEVSRVRMKAIWPGGSVVGTEVSPTFRINFLGIKTPRYATQLYGTTVPGSGGREYHPGEQSFTTPEEIQVNHATLKILK